MTARLALATLTITLATGCLPYIVGSTAQTVPAGETTRTGIVYYIPDAVDLDQAVAGPMRGSDVEIRYGLDDKSDIGFRVPAYSGAVFTYKRRVAGTANPDSAAMSVMAGGGFVNFGEHAETELTFLASGREAGGVVTPYGGLRAMQVVPMSRSAVHDTPTAGGFIGMRMRFGDVDVSPELGVYYDRSALGLRSTNYIIVPGVSLSPRRARPLHRPARQ
jgi:hypothetical protein